MADVLRQGDPRWGEIVIATAKLKDIGCLATVLSEIIGCTPDVFVARMKSVGGFSGNLVKWGSIGQAFPGISVYRYWGYDNNKVRAFVPNVVVEVPGWPIGGSAPHWVRYMGNQRLHDPWTGTDRPTSAFPGPTGFAIIQGRWTQQSYSAKDAIGEIRNIVNSPVADATARQQIRDVIARVS